MRFIIVLLFVVLSSSLKAQSGFIQAYDLDEAGMGFYNMLLVEDTLVVYGTVKHPDLPQWGLYFSKMDTLGNILDYKVYYDSLGDSYSFEQGYEIIKTSDGGYALVGQMFFRQFPVLIKLDVNGNLEFVQEYPDTTVYDIRHWNIIEIENGYISTGVKQQMDDGLRDAFIMRTDKRGNKIWEIDYGGYGLNDGFRGVKKLNANKILLTGATGVKTPIINPPQGAWTKAIAIKIDTLGNVLWEWESEPTIHGEGSAAPFGDIYRANDGNWVNEGYYNVIEDFFGEPTLLSKGEIVKRDTNFNVIWSTPFGETTNTTNGFTDIVQTPDEGWVAVGEYSILLPNDPLIGYRTSMIAKVNANGDSLWSRTDTLFSHLAGDSRPYLSGVVALPSGSIIACGHVNKFSPSPSKSYGWLIKVDKDGCMESNCHPVSNGENLMPMIEDIFVFPNPTSDKIHISGKGYFDIELLSAKGSLLYHQEGVYEQTELELNAYPSGIYFLKVKKGNRMIMKRIVKR